MSFGLTGAATLKALATFHETVEGYRILTVLTASSSTFTLNSTLLIQNINATYPIPTSITTASQLISALGINAGSPYVVDFSTPGVLNVNGTAQNISIPFTSIFSTTQVNQMVANALNITVNSAVEHKLGETTGTVKIVTNPAVEAVKLTEHIPHQPPVMLETQLHHAQELTGVAPTSPETH